MLKLQYDEKTGVVGKAYPSSYDVAIPYKEIDEATNDKIAADAENIYFVVNNELTTTPTDGYKTKQLAGAKNIKLQENTTKRDARLIAGVTYKNILFDSDQDQKINLVAIASSMSDTDTISWYGKDGISSLSCTKADIEAIGALITKLTQDIWSNLNPTYINKINACTTIDAVNALVIDYTNAGTAA